MGAAATYSRSGSTKGKTKLAVPFIASAIQAVAAEVLPGHIR